MEESCVTASKTYTERPRKDMFKVHFHEDYELFCFLSGSAKYYVEGEIYPLKPKDIMLMKIAESHALLIDKTIPYERLIINFSSDAIVGNLRDKIISFLNERPLGKYNKYSLPKHEREEFLSNLLKICNTDDDDEKMLYLTLSLNELRKKEPYGLGYESTDNIGEIIHYINEHLFEDISLDSLSKKFYLSKVHLIRKFKSYVGSTVWEYISTKRLIKAQELLKLGEKPTVVAAKCGFNDYCTFYRSYKARYGISPKEAYVKI